MSTASTNPTVIKWSYFVILLILCCSLTFSIVAVSLHNLYTVTFDQDDGFDGYGSSTWGAFSGCVDMEGTDPSDGITTFIMHHCYSIPPDCVTTWHLIYNNTEVYWDLNEDQNGIRCQVWNPFRAFFVIGIILTGFTIAAISYQYLTSSADQLYRSSRPIRLFCHICGWAAVVAIIISYAVIGSEITDAEGKYGIVLSRGPAFALEATAWVIEVVAMILYAILDYIITKNRTEQSDTQKFSQTGTA